MSQGRPTLADVATAAGVSVSTASLAFSGAGPIAPETKARVHDAAAQLGYCGPNPLGRSLRSGRSGIVAAVIGVLLIPATAAADGGLELDPLLASAPMDVAVLIWGARSGDRRGRGHDRCD